MLLFKFITKNTNLTKSFSQFKCEEKNFFLSSFKLVSTHNQRI